MAKRTIEFEDTTGPFTVKLKGDSQGSFTLLIHDNGSVSRPTKLHIDLESSAVVEKLGLLLQSMADDIATELNR